MDLDAIARSLDGQGLEHGNGAAPALIDGAAAQLRVQLPASYRAFLGKVGWADIGRFEVLGLGNDVPPYLDLVRVTEIERTSMNPHLPLHLLPVANDGAGNYYCVDTRETSCSESPVVFWDHELDAHQEPDEVATDFGAWITAHVSAVKP